jgi:uncharacterized delta-60 repeat protein
VSCLGFRPGTGFIPPIKRFGEEIWRLRSGALVGALLIAFGLGTTATASPGRPDRGFGRHGVFTLKLSREAEVERADVVGNARDGYVALAGLEDGRSILVRVTPAGRLDRSFGDGGFVRLGGGPWNAVARTGDGRIVLAGAAPGQLAFERLLPDGSPDPTFGVAGVVLHRVDPIPPNPFFRTYIDLHEEAVDIALDPDGSVVAVVNLRLYREDSYVLAGTAVIRLTSSGGLDPGFADGGILETTSATGGRIKELNRLVQQPDGKLLLAGNARGLAIARISPDGHLDAGFAHGGLLLAGTDTFNYGEGIGQLGDARTVLVRPDGHLIVVGQTTLLGLRADGRIDHGFGRNGVVYTGDGFFGVGPHAENAALDAKGRILIAGDNADNTVVARFLPDGAIDRRFAGEGMSVVNLDRSSGESGEAATALLVGADGSTLTAGFVNGRRGHRLALIARSGGDGILLRCNGVPAVLHGTPGPDRLHGRGPIVGMGGDDVIVAYGGPVCAGAGDDVIHRASGFVSAGPGDDRVLGSSGDIHGGAGNDQLQGEAGPDRIFGGGGADRLLGGSGRDTLFGGAGEDVLLGEGGADRIFGGSGDDRLRGESGGDELHGGSGVDQIQEGADGRPKTVFAMHREGFHVRLRVEGHAISGISLDAVTNCANGEQGGVGIEQNRAHLAIHANGHFREVEEWSTEYGYSTLRFEGTVHPDRITGTFMYEERESTTCRTGTRKNPKIHFVARRRG